MTTLTSRSKIFSTLAVCALLSVSGCALTENYLKADRDTNQNIQDYRDYLAPREVPLEDKTADADVPALQPYIADNSENMKPMPLVSISINQTIPLRDALFELAKQADYDVQLDPRITGSVIFTARNRPFDVVIEQLCDIAGLRYSFDNDILRVELDTPYTKTYKVGYLSFVRENKSSIKTNVTVGGSGGGGGGGGEGGESGSTAETTTGSEFSIDSKSTSDFWAELDSNLKQILESNSSLTYLKTDTDPAISVSTASPLPPVPPIDESALQGGAAANIAPQAGGTSIRGKTGVFPQIEPAQVVPSQPATAQGAAPPSAAAVVPATDATVPAPTAAQPAAAPAQPASATATPQETVLQIQSLPTGEGGQTANQNAVDFKPSFAINKQAGLVTVFASERIHRRVKEYLDKLEKTSAQQVLIEAKVLEVELNDEFSAGIDWSLISSSFLGLRSLSFNGAAPALTPADSTTLNAQFSQGEFNAAITALSRFGTARALASPRLTVLNNQPAVLNVAQNRVYFEIKSERESGTTTNPATTNFTSEVKNVPEGVLINVLPSVDAETNTISMQIRPTISRVTGFVNDPIIAIQFAQAGVPVPAGVSNQVPIVNVKEMDSVVRMKSEETIVMGGLLEDRGTGTQRAVPIAGEVPVVGALFRNQGDQVRKTELVIFIKATILNTGNQTIHNTDRELYRVYGQDRRPFRM